MGCPLSKYDDACEACDSSQLGGDVRIVGSTGGRLTGAVGTVTFKGGKGCRVSFGGSWSQYFPFAALEDLHVPLAKSALRRQGSIREPPCSAAGEVPPDSGDQMVSAVHTRRRSLFASSHHSLLRVLSCSFRVTFNSDSVRARSVGRDRSHVQLPWLGRRRMRAANMLRLRKAGPSSRSLNAHSYVLPCSFRVLFNSDSVCARSVGRHGSHFPLPWLGRCGMRAATALSLIRIPCLIWLSLHLMKMSRRRRHPRRRHRRR
jgi:hypothetical protein